jgi:hypothetical protein
MTSSYNLVQDNIAFKCDCTVHLHHCRERVHITLPLIIFITIMMAMATTSLRSASLVRIRPLLRQRPAVFFTTLSRRRRGGSASAVAVATPKDPHSFDPSKLDPSLISAMGSCLEDASLSPFLPVPDAVARKMLDIAKAAPTDIHYELGSGDGRVNFHATDPHSFDVQKSVGVEIDARLIEMSKERLLLLEGEQRQQQQQQRNVHFIQADLMNPNHKVWQDMEDEATVVTMYFVENALFTISESLEKLLKQQRNCRIVTCGYPIPNWHPQRVQQLLGLSIHLYQFNTSDSDGSTNN